MIRTVLSLSVCAAMASASWSCLSVQDFGGSAAPAAQPAEPETQEDGQDSQGLDPSQAEDAPARWQWVHPAPGARKLIAIGGTSKSDIWAAGEGGTVAHFDGKSWTVHAVGAKTTRYFSIGTRSANDVYVAGTDDDGKTVVVHYDGTGWTESYPFAGAVFRMFSGGHVGRLLALTEEATLELDGNGTWVPTDERVGGVHGRTVDVWVSASGDAWAITGRGVDVPAPPTTIGGWLMRLPAGSRTWTIQGPPDTVPKHSLGLALSGAGDRPCAFYGGEDPSAGIGFLEYDGASWHAAPPSATWLSPSELAGGVQSACFSDGSGVLVAGEALATGTKAGVAPVIRRPVEVAGRGLFATVSFDGTRAFAVGAAGAFMTRTAASTEWKDTITAPRNDLIGVDVGGDGSVVTVDAKRSERVSGGDVVSWEGGAAKVMRGSGLGAPLVPLGVAVVDRKDVWVLAGDSSNLGIAHWNGSSWEGTRILAHAMDGLAIWAAAKNDVWVTAQAACPDRIISSDGRCSEPQPPFAWHYDGKAWKRIEVTGTYRAIHGSSANDVWFAGDSVAHWDGQQLARVPSLGGSFTGVWATAPDRVWLSGSRAIFYDGHASVPVEKALGVSSEWSVQGIAESQSGDVFVLTKQAVGTALLWFDGRTKRLVEQLSSDLSLTTIRGRGNQLWAVGAGGAALRFAPSALH